MSFLLFCIWARSCTANASSLRSVEHKSAPPQLLTRGLSNHRLPNPEKPLNLHCVVTVMRRFLVSRHVHIHEVGRDVSLVCHFHLRWWRRRNHSSGATPREVCTLTCMPPREGRRGGASICDLFSLATAFAPPQTIPSLPPSAIAFALLLSRCPSARYGSHCLRSANSVLNAYHCSPACRANSTAGPGHATYRPAGHFWDLLGHCVRVTIGKLITVVRGMSSPEA